jgi:rod shape determining protein RodA
MTFLSHFQRFFAKFLSTPLFLRVVRRKKLEIKPYTVLDLVIKRFKELDFILLFAVFVVSGIGVLSIYSSNPSLYLRQIFFVVAGFFLMFAISFIDWRAFKENSYFILILYFLSIASLYGLFVFAPAIRGVHRWYRIGDFLFDPAEVFKIIIIILLAKYFSTRHVEMYKISHIILSGIYVAIPAFLIFRQPDLGSASILIVMWLGVLLISGIKLRHFIALILIGLVIFSAGWLFFLEDYHRDRAISFINPGLDPQGIGWGQAQAQIAIGSGGILGKGLGEGTQTQYGFLPEAETDYIFSAIAEEMGFLGVFVLLTFLAIFLWRIILVILHSKTNFPRLFAVGFTLLILTQAFVNIGMNLGLLPIIGTPLPLVSYGGSNLLFVFLGLGILQSIRRDIKY